jgi:surface antigen
VIVGGTLGATLTRNLDCEDRSYAYKTYSDGFNTGRANAAYQWRNPSNGHYGDFRVGDYFNDQDGFRCANYTQRIYVNNRPQATTGRACQQPNGTWVIVN